MSVARIAYLSSDVVVSVQPSLAADSEFSKFLNQYADNKASGVVSSNVPEVRLTLPSIAIPTLTPSDITS